MSISKSKGNMFKFVTHCVNMVGGECPHQCQFCYVKRMEAPAVRAKYSGAPRITSKDILRRDRVYFVSNMTDLFAADVPAALIREVLAQLEKFPHNRYLFLTKSPARYLDFKTELKHVNYILGVTIESDLQYPDTKAPPPFERLGAMLDVRDYFGTCFISIEPIMNFTSEYLAWLRTLRPTFVAIGANTTKEIPVPEPAAGQVLLLIAALKRISPTLPDDLDFMPNYRAEMLGHPYIELKDNLDRIIGKQALQEERQKLEDK